MKQFKNNKNTNIHKTNKHKRWYCVGNSGICSATYPPLLFFVTNTSKGEETTNEHVHKPPTETQRKTTTQKTKAQTKTQRKNTHKTNQITTTTKYKTQKMQKRQSTTHQKTN